MCRNEMYNYISVFLDVAKFANFWWKYADISRTQGMPRMIHIVFGSSLGKIKLCQLSSLLDMCARF